MIPHLRQSFNASWTEARFRDLVRRLELRSGATLGFPLSETPCFFPESLMSSLAATGIELVNQILTNRDALAAADAAVPERFRGAGAEALPSFLQVDFGLVRDESGAIQPKLVELQAFASLYGFQQAVAEAVVSPAVAGLMPARRLQGAPREEMARQVLLVEATRRKETRAVAPRSPRFLRLVAGLFTRSHANTIRTRQLPGTGAVAGLPAG